MKLNFLGLGLAAVICGCTQPMYRGQNSSTATIEDTKPPFGVACRELYSEEALAPYRGSGNSTVTGEVFATTRGGSVKIGAGKVVFLLPATKEVVKTLMLFIDYNEAASQYRLNEKEKEIWFEANSCNVTPKLHFLLSKPTLEVIRITKSNSRGEFKFSEIPKGQYIAFCPHFWVVDNSGAFPEYSGDFLYELVDVKDNSAVEVSLGS